MPSMLSSEESGLSVSSLPAWVAPVCAAAAGLGTIGAGYLLYKRLSAGQADPPGCSTRTTQTPAQILREKEFFLDNSAVLVNNGSYGTVPRCIHAKQEELHLEMEQHPDKWFRETVRQKMPEAALCVAKFFNAPEECVGFVTNATTGVNAVLSSYPFKAGDQVNGIQSKKNEKQRNGERRGGKGCSLKPCSRVFSDREERASPSIIA